MWYFKYPLEGDASKFIMVGTTRPETLFGDTAVAVSDQDERYKDFVGKNVLIPIINKPIPKISCEDILTQLRIKYDEKVHFPPVLDGGPDRKMQGFILHTPDVFYPETVAITNEVHLTATQEILTDIALGKAPQNYLITVGCCTWSPSQMEEEIMGNVWLTAPANLDILFHTPYEERWDKALRQLGIIPENFSVRAGKA